MQLAVTVNLPSELKEALDDFTRREGIATDDVVGQAIQEHIFLRQFRTLRDRLSEQARRQGIVSDEDVFEHCS